MSDQPLPQEQVAQDTQDSLTSVPIDDTASEQPNNVSSSDLPPPLPPRKDSPHIIQPLSFTLSDGISKISAVRQVEIYSSPQFHETSDLFVNNTLGNDTIRAKIDVLKGESDNEDIQYWVGIVEDYSNQFLKGNEGIDQVEQKVISGIPNEVRYLVYLKTLQVRYKLSSKETFSSLLNKARHANGSYEYIDKSTQDSNAKDLLIILDYLVNEVGSKAEHTRVNLTKFVINSSAVINQIQEFSPEERLYVLLKLNKLYQNLIKEEFFYKVNRTLEDELTDVFKHITLQGINLNSTYKEIIGNFFNKYFEDFSINLKILDFVIFEGFDFILRLIVWAVSCNKEKILQIDGDELLEFINSKELFSGPVNFQDILNIQPEIIKYENEFHLIHANSFNSNRNELTNLREVNDDLMIKVNELKQKIDTLQTTHQEIMNQSKEYKEQLSTAQQVNEKLTQEKQELNQKYEELTMKENLQNTIKANKEFYQRNNELQQQVDEVREKIEEMKVKLSKVSPVPVEGQ
ncbi:uncharacterized protein SPAPADRAFT_61780 [Spathaspora passalidarum NRRL Y-27907]|uniref:Rab-GAP TBC domain-containing protein n=1 Tax=Spathaspora passalidarum (strain NRRL Y-27907 / 11-Y1) TaxID=619300 RepID=G3AQX0_SPAPN|nr:uncharacterized protein SPAPADRAFT_61780 [Spathaspora passalidarum NRRL Y-27907]EGW31199.1 hypothetical protein SPAPADRAFT_61780 [Spathaspora passalidarum NRRL Y-27907]